MDHPRRSRSFPLYWWIPLLLFVVHYLLTSLINRPAADDFEFLSVLQEKGITGSVRHFYHTWNTRWAAIGFLNTILQAGQWLNTWFWYHLAALLLLWSALLRIVESFSGLSRPANLMLAGYALIALCFSLFSIPQTLFWLNTSAMYFWSLIALLTAVGYYLKAKKKAGSTIVLALSAVYIGGANEPLAITLLVAVTTYSIIKSIRSGTHTYDAALPVFLSFLLISFLVGFAGEGNRIRASFLPQNDWDFKLLAVGKALVKMFLLYGPPKLLSALLFSFPWMLLAGYGWMAAPSLRQLKWATVILLLLVTISLVPMSWLMSEMGPERALSQISLYLTGYAILFMIWLGGKWKGRLHLKMIPVVYLSLVTLYLSFNAYSKLKADVEYTKGYDHRMELLMRYRDEGTRGVMMVPPLPLPGWLYSSEIDTSAGHFTNRHLHHYLKTDFQIVRGEPQN